MLHFIWKYMSQSLEEEWRGTESMLLEVQCEVSTVSDDLGCHVIHCVFWSPQSTQHLPGNFRALRASFCWKALWRCWFHFPAGLGTCPHCQMYQKLVQWPWCYCAWLASKLAWPEPHRESLGYCQEEDERHRPIALTPIIMKCFERLVMHNIKTSPPNTLDLLQFAYRPNRSTDDAISFTLHLALTHLENKDSYVKMLFIDFSSAFNTIILQSPGLSNRKTSFSQGRPQHLKHYHAEHRCPTGLCDQPAALHAADHRLQCPAQLQPHHQVCRWHISGRSHQQQQWNTLQRWSGTAGWMVLC